MTIKTELLKKYIQDHINFYIDDFEIDPDKIADTTAITILSEIQKTPREFISLYYFELLRGFINLLPGL